MPKFSSSDREGGMFSSIKSRLGFGGDAASERRSSRSSRDDDYDDYGDYEEYDYDDYDDESDTVDSSRDWDRGSSRSSRSSRYDSGYGDYNDYSSDYDRPSSYRPIDTSYSPRRSGADFPQLVTMDDVKMSTPLPDLPPIDLPSDESARPGSRTVVDNTAPAPYSPAARAASEGRQRGEGLDSLFGSSSAAGTSRTLKVIKPVSYEDAEGVAKGIKAGAVVVLALRNTPSDLGKRILDFAFGAASALDASVECPGEKVFAIARGRALDESELAQLRNQGVL